MAYIRRVFCFLWLSAAVSSPQSPPIQFRNVAEAAGLRFVLENNPTPEKQIIETMAGGVAVFDYDGDGLTDIFFTNGASVPTLEKKESKFHNRLFRNLGGMKFKDVTAETGLAGTGYSIGASAADYDNDGRTDLFVAGVRSNHLYHNLGNGRFEEVTAKAGIKSDLWSIAGGWLDYDNDGRLDLFVVNYLDWIPDKAPFCGDSVKNVRAYCHPKHFRGLPNTLYRNRGDGTFEDVSESAGIAHHVGKGMSIALADYDQDGFTDVFVTNDKIPNFLFHNLGNGKFEEVALESGVAMADHARPISAMGADFRDYDNDGLPDIVVAALAGEWFPLFRNLGRGRFRDWTDRSSLSRLSIDRSGWSPLLYDFNNDGRKDLFVSGAHVVDNVEYFEPTKYKVPNCIFLNAGNGSFRDVSGEAGPDFQTPRAHRGAAVADFDSDGRLDVVVAVLGGMAELWENTGSSGGSWLVLRLNGARSNKDGIGASVRIGTQHNHVTVNGGYASSSNFGVHFGLGSVAKAAGVEIRWPSGVKQVLVEVPANQVLQVSEPPD